MTTTDTGGGRHRLPTHRNTLHELRILRHLRAGDAHYIKRLQDRVRVLDARNAAKDKQIADLQQRLKVAEHANALNYLKTCAPAAAAVRGFRPEHPAETQAFAVLDDPEEKPLVTGWRARLFNPLPPCDTETTVTLPRPAAA